MFKGKWITTKDFVYLTPINVYRKETDSYRPEKTHQHLMNNHCRFRKKFTVENSCCRYKINISADDYYKLYVNGRFVCQGPAANVHTKYYFNTFDITEFVKEGDNVIGVEVYYQGYINRVWNSGDNRQGLIADVFRDDEFVFGTDESWLYTYAREYIDGGTTGYETQFLENIDFNLANPYWNKVNYDDSCYINAIIKTDDDHVFCGSVPTVDVYTVKPVLVKQLSPTHLFVDMGKEYTGYLHFTVRGNKGEKVIIRCGEETLENNPYSVRYEMRCNCRYEEVCTLSGGEDEFLFYDYKTFRYAEIISESDCLKPDEIEMTVRHHKFNKQAYSISSSEPLIENIWEICAHALTIGVQEGYLDCPSREKGQYLGDFVVSGLAHLYLTGDWQMYRKTLLEFADYCFVCDGMMAVAPGSLMQEIADFSLLYPHAVANYYKYTGDKKTTEKLIPVIDGIMEYFSKYRRSDGLLEGVVEKWNLVYWPENLRDNYDFNLKRPHNPNGCHNVVNAYYCFALKTVEELKSALGIEFKSDVELVCKAFVKEFYNPKLKLFTDTSESEHTSLHANVLPVIAGIAPEEAKENIHSLIMSKGLCCGVWFSYFVLKALAKLGAYGSEYELIVNRSEHSWYNMISEGATTCYEAWGKEQKWNTSLCHPWASSPVIALIEDIAGIAPTSFFTSSLRTDSHIPSGVKLAITLPCKDGSIVYDSEKM